MTCKTCIYSKLASYRFIGGDADVVECRRHAPSKPNESAKWPFVKDDDWCGEYQPDQQETQRILRRNLDAIRGEGWTVTPATSHFDRWCVQQGRQVMTLTSDELVRFGGQI